MLNIVYEDKDKLIVNKPAGQLSQSGKNFELDLVSEVLAYRKKKGEPAYAAIINRLDRPVSGLVLFAKNKESAARLSKVETFNKQYICYVVGKPANDSGELVDYLIKDEKDNVSRVVKGVESGQDVKINNDIKNNSQREYNQEIKPGAKLSKLKYELLEYDDNNNVSKLKIHLITGRHHQIRVQLSSRNMYILGDNKYGSEEANNPGLLRKYRIKRGQIGLSAVSIVVDGEEYKI